ncbi:hypothetical protein [Streptomyces sp. NBC_00233]|uniref:hypothetical protein n=1 Tax=Streptomyces sp. NBC_00233 TaxID=2975686 RepID=UPI00225409FF|nr:hypothetical protein [Streptomyces sp. NBC_00233]MCX5232834.1 hypothetical protein [Streptomyces sp. NBC_00233]
MNIHPPDKVLSELLARSRLTPGRDLAELVTRAGRQMGLTCTAVYVADLQQDTLQALPQSPALEDPALGVDSSLEGLPTGRSARSARRMVTPRGCR